VNGRLLSMCWSNGLLWLHAAVCRACTLVVLCQCVAMFPNIDGGKKT
jgi:hypothetical protein